MGMGSPKFLVDSHVRLQRHWAKAFVFPGQRLYSEGGIAGADERAAASGSRCRERAYGPDMTARADAAKRFSCARYPCLSRIPPKRQEPRPMP